MTSQPFPKWWSRNDPLEASMAAKYTIIYFGVSDS
jgi:hypothetical protein